VNPTFITTGLLDALTAEARAHPRGRRNRNFHASEAEPCNRLLNAIEPGSYVRPHCHLEAHKDETIVVLRGRLGVLIFDHTGNIAQKQVLAPGSGQIGLDIPHGTLHSMLALEPGTVFFEAKAGPYTRLSGTELASFAPAEGSMESAAYCDWMRSQFG
jgi:cupin fold WbuC family metalloprotein